MNSIENRLRKYATLKILKIIMRICNSWHYVTYIIPLVTVEIFQLSKQEIVVKIYDLGNSYQKITKLLLKTHLLNFYTTIKNFIILIQCDCLMKFYITDNLYFLNIL